MRIGLIQAYEPGSKFQALFPPLGMGYLAAYMRQFRPNDEYAFFSDLDELTTWEPHLVGVTSVSENFGIAREIGKSVQEKLDVPLIIGGTHISGIPHILPREYSCGVLGEGEETFRELIPLFDGRRPSKEELSEVLGIVYHDGNEKRMTPSRPSLADMDSLPHPDRVMLGENWRGLEENTTYIFSARGCPFKCSFCSSTLYWRKYRSFSPDYVADEIEDLYSNHGIENIAFYDDLFIASRKWLVEMAQVIRDRGLHKKLKFGCSVKAEMVNDGLVDLLKSMNITRVNFGAESGSQKVLTELKQRTTRVEDNQNTIDLFYDNGISVGASFIVGDPGEGEAELRETYDFIKLNSEKLAEVDIYPLIPFPGTAKWKEAVDQGLVEERESFDWKVLSLEIDELDFDKHFFFGHMDRKAFENNYLRLLLLRQTIVLGEHRRESERARDYVQKLRQEIEDKNEEIERAQRHLSETEEEMARWDRYNLPKRIAKRRARKGEGDPSGVL